MNGFAEVVGGSVVISTWSVSRVNPAGGDAAVLLSLMTTVPQVGVVIVVVSGCAPVAPV